VAAELLIGPILRHVGERDASVWVEVSEECEVKVLGAKERTFCVSGHHYALVCIDDLEPATKTPYEVHLDGELAWPPSGSELPEPVIRTIDPDRPLRILYGSCRVALPHEPPYTLDKDEDKRGRGHDALWVLAHEMLDSEDHHWPDLLMLLGDQVYADEVSPKTLEYIRSVRDTNEPPGEEVANFEEYTHLYLESWTDPMIRWLLSTVPSAMVIDDHDMHDDWNISRDWVEEMRSRDWWKDRVLGGLASYWVYQHLGNLSPRSLADNDLYRRVREADDGYDELAQFAAYDDRRHEGVRWSYCRELGRTKLIVVDDRTGRELEPGNRDIADEEEWRWIEEEARGDCDHLVIGVSDPYLLMPALHHMEAWNEAVCNGAWGRRMSRLAERMRQGADFDHWPSFNRSFRRLADLLAEIGSREDAPATISLLSGDVHHAYLAEVAFANGTDVTSAVHQLVCSPFRNALDSHERLSIRATLTRPARGLARWLARRAGVPDPPIRWRVTEGPYFDNQAGTLVLDGQRATALLDKTVRDDDARAGARLERVYERSLT
jgi:PhoD-like phosphatase